MLPYEVRLKPSFGMIVSYLSPHDKYNIPQENLQYKIQTHSLKLNFILLWNISMCYSHHNFDYFYNLYFLYGAGSET